MKIAIIGKGGVGQTLGRRFSEAGHEVRFGIRNPSAAEDFSIPEAGRWAEAVVLAVPFSGAQEALAALGDLHGKVLIDLVNAIKPDFSGLQDLESSVGELVAGWIPSARVVKAFNTVGVAVMADPNFHGQAATLMIAGDDADAKATTSSLATSIGFAPVDAGGIAMSHYLEAFAWLWINQAFRQGQGHGFVFQLVTR